MTPIVVNGRTVEGRARPVELARALTADTYRSAYDQGLNLSLWLEQEDPSADYVNDPEVAGLDAFERILYSHGIVTRSNPASGLWASTPQQVEEIADGAGRMLVPEMFSRFWRSVCYGGSPSTRAFYTSSDDIVGGSARPWVDATTPRWNARRRPPIMLQDIVAINTRIDSDVYRAFYLISNDTEQRMARVTEGTEVPGAKITGGDNTIKLKKFGRRVDQSYESMRRMRIDKVRAYIERLAIQTEMDKVSEAINVLVSGDGNTNVATSATNWRAKTDLDSAASSKTITLKAWLAFKMKFFPAYNLTHVLATEGDILKLALVNIGSAGVSEPVYLADVTAPVGATTSNRLRDGTEYGVTADVPADKLVAIDASAALEHVVEIGSDITEVERWARRQVESIIMTETMGFAIFDPGANKTLELET